MRIPLTAGKIEPKLARHCAWCDRWMSEADRERHEAGARTTDTICLSCRREHFPDLPATP